MTTETTDKTQNKAKGKRLTEAEWQQIVAIWETGGVRARDIADQFHITAESISRGLKKRGAVYGRHATSAARRLIEAATDEFEVAARRARETKEDHYKISAYFAKLAAKKIQDAESGKTSYAQADEEIKALLGAMKVNSAARSERWAILGLDREDVFDPDTLPELSIREMTGQEVENVKDAQEKALKEIGAIEIVSADSEGPDLGDGE
jgi:DNA-binding MarR family transcriptional regulator